jgi:hypothetical protein
MATAVVTFSGPNGVYLHGYMPAYYYPPAYYGWAYNPWPAPAPYAWGLGCGFLVWLLRGVLSPIPCVSERSLLADRLHGGGESAGGVCSRCRRRAELG